MEKKLFYQKDLFSTQDDNCKATGLGLWYYCKNMLITILISIYIALNIVKDI